MKGLDYAWGYPGVTAIKKGGYEFVVRYVSHDRGKNLTRAEAEQLTEADIWIALIWETTADRAGSGKTAGIVDATNALVQAKDLGMPEDRPIYFAVDWDAQPGDDHAIHAYLDGCAAILGRSRVGLYAGYGPIKRAFDAEKIAFGWQTYAWSGKKWDSRAQLQQYSNGHNVGGTDCDYNRTAANVTDFGQWMIGKVPDMLSEKDKEWLVEAIQTEVSQTLLQMWAKDECPAPYDITKENPNWQFRNVLRTAASEANNAHKAIEVVGSKIDRILSVIDEDDTPSV